MSLKGFISNGLAIRVAIVIGKGLSRRAGYRLANFVGSWISKRHNFSMVKAVKANQWVVSGGKKTKTELKTSAKEVFQSSLRCMFDYYHYMGRSSKLLDIIEISPEAQAAFNRIHRQEPTLIVVSHLSSFELIGYALALMKLKILVLSFPNPNEAYRLQNKLRKRAGLEILPMSLSAFRIARERLSQGGCVLTGLDRPIIGSQLDKYRPIFFGHETNLPVAYIRMAKEANAPIFVMSCKTHPDNTYSLESSQPISVTPMDNLEKEIMYNAARVLAESENQIREVPEQWAMFYPVWPDIMKEEFLGNDKEQSGKKSG